MLGALIAVLCVNEVQLTVPVIEDLAEVETLIARGAYDEARDLLEAQPLVDDEHLRMRATDLRAVLALRAKKPKEITAWVLPHFADRYRANNKAPRFQAWLAEARLAEGHTAAALALVTDLKTKDLMPDAYAYVVLARLTTGEERDAALAACRTRTKAKAICVVPKLKS